MDDAIINQIGGEAGVKKLVEKFYDHIETHEKGSDIHKLHMDGHGVTHARNEQFDFLSGFFGGRRYYYEKHKHMNVKLVHEHVPIHPIDAENWLFCMNLAMEECGISGKVKDQLYASFEKVAQSLVNDGKTKVYD